MRILLLGFSVTADRAGYAELLKNQIDELTVVGIGGINPLPLPGIFDAIMSKHRPFDFVLLEISTSIYSSIGAEEEAKNVLHDLIHRIQSTGASAGFVSLYRDDFNYETQLLDPIIRSMCERLGLPLLDIGPALLRSRGRDFCRTLIRDVVHTNEQGAEFQAKQVRAFIDGLENAPNQKRLPPPKIRHYQMALGNEHFSRTGWECSYLTIPVGQAVTIRVPKSAVVYGISCITDPTAGTVRVSADRSHTVPLLYQHSYYSHYCFHRINLKGSVTVEQLPVIPDIQLLKGSISQEARTCKLAAVHLVENLGSITR